MVPDTLLLARPSTRIEESWHIGGGISPLNLLDLQRRASRLVLSPIQLGIIPVNSFSPRLMSPKDTQFFSDKDRLLLPKFTWVKDFQYFQHGESSPDRRLFDASRTSKLLFLFAFRQRKEEMGPEIVLFAMFNTLTFEDKRGS